MVFDFSHPSGKGSILGELDTNGVFTFAVFASPDSPIRGTELIQKMMQAFGTQANFILGVWRKEPNASINIDKVNELTAKGITLEDAVSQTWIETARVSRKYGKCTYCDQVKNKGICPTVQDLRVTLAR